MNIYDVSNKAGVSIATVSRVINNSDVVSEKTRKKVLAAIEELEYVPNAFARGLGNNTMKTIGIMCANASDKAALFPPLVFVGLTQYMKKKIAGYTGDCCGATFLFCEISFYLAVLIIYSI